MHQYNKNKTSVANLNATNKCKDLIEFKSLKITCRCGQVLHRNGHLCL